MDSCASAKQTRSFLVLLLAAVRACSIYTTVRDGITPESEGNRKLTLRFT